MRSPIILLFPFLLLAQEAMYTRTQIHMGTFVNITLPKTQADHHTKSFELIQRIETSLSSYDPNASLFKLNHTHHIGYDPYLVEAITLSRSYYGQTNGYFDITIGSITKDLYHFGEETIFSPSKNMLDNAYLDIQGISVDKNHIRTDANITIDLGGMGKGYAVDKVAEYLNEQNITQGILALSGDIRCLDRCEVYLQSPYSEETFAKVKSKKAQFSISTSGPYRRYANTKEEHHLINPKTATQGNEFVSVSLFSTANNAKIDAYATALSVMPKAEAVTFLKNMKNIGFVVIDKEGKILYGNLKDLADIEWIDHKENATSPIINKNDSTNSDSATSLIHPDTTNPKVIAK